MSRGDALSGRFGLVPRQSAAGREAARRTVANLVTPEPSYAALPCAQCGELHGVMVTMAPGLDHQPWALCRACWSDGAPESQPPNFGGSSQVPAATRAAAELPGFGVER